MLRKFYKSDQIKGIILILCTVISLLLSNTCFKDSYLGFWNYKVANHSLLDWINDGLMAIFFLLIGLELEKEIYLGEFAHAKNAILPIVGAAGGMIVPALIFFSFNFGAPTEAGAGIPMATDIAFALGILSLLGSKVPLSLKMFLTALAVIDDLGAIIIIAVCYTSAINLLNLSFALLVLLILLLLNRIKVYNIFPYIIGGIVIWYFMLNSGVRATITGVILAFVIPFRRGDETSPFYRFQRYLRFPIAFFILPLFALANTAIVFKPDWYSGFAQPNSIGIMAGLIIGKPLGITLFCYLAVLIGICKLPININFRHMLGVGFLGGIGFTMSIFITLLAFGDTDMETSSKLAILAGSVISGTIGTFYLKHVL